MTLYPSAVIRAAFASICRERGARRDSIARAYRCDDGCSLTLNWNFEEQRWAVLEWHFDRGSDWIASFVGPMARRPS
jgi:hypothetical protein